MRNAWLSLLLALGCLPHSTVRVDLYDTRLERDDIVYQACDFWGVDCAVEHGSNGAPIKVILTEHPAFDAGLAGTEFSQGLCYRVFWAYGRREVVIHELGHALGLSHSDAADNVMHPPPIRGAVATDSQREHAQAEAERLAATCNGR